jgi:hypothetical protein
LLVLLPGCDCGFHPVADCGTACDAGTADAGVTCNGCVSGTVGWGFTGGLVARRDSSSLDACRTYVHRRVIYNPMGTQGCQVDLETCPGFDVARVAALLADPVITAALMNHTLYGIDTRPSDGAVFEITTDGGSFDIGGCGMSECRPAQVKELQELLQALDQNQLSIEPCKSNIHSP